MNESSGSNPFNRGNTRNSDRNFSGNRGRSNNSENRRRPYDRATIQARRRDRKHKQRGKRTWGANSSFQNDNGSQSQNRNYSSYKDHNRREYYRRHNQMGGQQSSGVNSNGNDHFHQDAVSSGNIPQNDNNIADKPQSNSPNKPEETVKKTHDPKKLNENILASMTDNADNVRDIVLNIKKEKDSTEKSTKDDEDSDSDDSSDDSTLERLRKTVNNTLLSKPKGDDKDKKIAKKKESESSSDSSSSSSDSDEKSKQKEKIQAIIKKKIASEEEVISKQKEKIQAVNKKKTSSEEEVICLGKMERIENLVEDEDNVPQPIQETETKSCLLCDQEGHTPIQCFMVCKNCNASYHGMRDCPKPPNMSLMLQYFMQFCLDQCCKYNPAEKFNVPNAKFTSHEEDNLDYRSLVNNSSKLRTRKSSIDAASSISKQSRKRRSESSSENSETSSDESSKKKRRRRTKSSKEFEIPTGMPFNPTAYNPAIPFPFNPPSIGYNPLMAFNQMMAYNNPSLKRSSGRSRKSK